MPYKTAVKSIRMFLVCCDMDRLCSSTVLHVHCPYNDASLHPHAPAPPPPTDSKSLSNFSLFFLIFFSFSGIAKFSAASLFSVFFLATISSALKNLTNFSYHHIFSYISFSLTRKKFHQKKNNNGGCYVSLVHGPFLANLHTHTHTHDTTTISNERERER